MKQYRTIFVVVMTGIIAAWCATAQAAGWYDLSWSQRKSITIDPGSVADDLTDYPVLLSVVDAELQARAKADGSDIVITAADGTTKLPREIEKWDKGTGTLVLWFNSQTLSSTVANTFYLYFGNGSASEVNDTATWEPKFVMVQHFNENPQGTNPDGIDSTSYGNDAIASAGLTSADFVQGKIGNAWDFDKSQSDYASVAADSSLNVTHVTAEAWINTKSLNNGSYRWYVATRKYMASTHDCSWELCVETDEKPEFYLGSYYSGLAIKSAEVAATNVWYYLVGTYNVATGRIYVDGTYKKGANRTDPLYSTRALLIGKADFHLGEYYDGAIDELRLSDTVRTPQWIETSYSNMVNPTVFCTLSDAEGAFAGTLLIVK